jgi:hypothetical protein
VREMLLYNDTRLLRDENDAFASISVAARRGTIRVVTSWVPLEGVGILRGGRLGTITQRGRHFSKASLYQPSDWLKSLF